MLRRRILLFVSPPTGGGALAHPIGQGAYRRRRDIPQKAGHLAGGKTPASPIRPGAFIIYAGVPCVQRFKKPSQF